MNFEIYSNAALVSAVVIYLLAMMAFAAEWASARRLPAQSSVRESVKVPEAQASNLALVGVDSTRSSAPTGGVDSTPSTGPDAAERAAQPADSGPVGPVEVRVELWGRIGVALTTVALFCNIGGVVLRSLAAGRPPWGNMYEFTITAMALIVSAFLVMTWKFGARWLGLPVTLLATIGNGLAVTVFYVAVAPLVPALHSVWFVIHVAAATIGGAAFNVGALLSALFLIRQRAERRGPVGGYLARIPSARQLDLYAYRFLAFAFPVWTFAVAAGAIWAEYAWGRYWGWDPKETWALVTWVIYAGYLHARATAGWRGTRAAVIALIGAASFWFNFVGINLLVSGLHSYAGI